MKNKYFDKMYNLDPSNWKMFNAFIFEDDKHIDVLRGNEEGIGEYTGKCQHCNHNHIHFVVVENNEGVRLSIGFDCYNETFAHDSKDKLDYARAKKKAESKANRIRINAKKDVYKEKHSDLLAFIESKQNNHFFYSLLSGFNRYGGLTEGQEKAAYKAMKKEKEYTENKKIWQKENEKASNAPDGRITQEPFEILSIKKKKTRFSYYGEVTLKMVAKHIEKGYKIYCTIPGSIECDDKKDSRAYNDMIADYEIVKGDKIRLNVTLTVSDDDKKFAWGKRPAKASLIV